MRPPQAHKWIPNCTMCTMYTTTLHFTATNVVCCNIRTYIWVLISIGCNWHRVFVNCIATWSCIHRTNTTCTLQSLFSATLQHIIYVVCWEWCAVRPQISVPQMSSSLTFHSRFYWSKSAIILLYTLSTFFYPERICVIKWGLTVHTLVPMYILYRWN